MTKIYLPYQNDEALSAEEFFRDLGKADAEDLAILNEDGRFSDVPPHPLAKMFGDPANVFYSPSPEQKQVALQKDVKTIVTKIGDTEIVAELNARGEVTRTFARTK
jgi:hypothetical protein